jgi:hypothetical protein
MIEIRPEDVGKRIWDMWTRGWMEVSFVAPGYVFLESDLFICKPDGTFNGAQRFAWEETPLPELRKRPREKKKIDLWVGVCHQPRASGSYATTDAHPDIETAKTEAAILGRDDSIHKITIEVEE